MTYSLLCPSDQVRLVNARVAVITGRDELDSRIERVFLEAGEPIKRTTSGNDLRLSITGRSRFSTHSTLAKTKTAARASRRSIGLATKPDRLRLAVFEIKRKQVAAVFEKQSRPQIQVRCLGKQNESYCCENTSLEQSVHIKGLPPGQTEAVGHKLGKAVLQITIERLAFTRTTDG